MRILVTGGAGYIGSHAVRLFLSRGHDVWVYDNLSMGHRQAVPAERLVVGDLNELHKLDHVIVAQQIEAAVLEKTNFCTPFLRRHSMKLIVLTRLFW